MQHFLESSLLLTAVVLIFIGPLVWQLTANIGPLKKLQTLADEAARTQRRTASIAKFGLSGEHATIVHKEESVTWFGFGIIVVSYSCMYFLRNEHGEYFMFIYRHGKRSFLKHVSHDIARIKLREKYIEPFTDERATVLGDMTENGQ